MRFLFDEAKSAEAAAYLLQLRGGRMSYLKLIKLLYLADRQSFIETGYPITGARMISMDKGPVLSEVYERVSWGDDPGGQWSRYISSPVNYEVDLLQPPELVQMSDFEIELLDRVYARFGHWDRSDLVRYCHELPEWQDPDGSSCAIDVRVILREAGFSDDEIHDVAAQVEAIAAFQRVAAPAR